MNKVILCGRLVRDPDVRYSAGNNPTAIGKYTLAVDRKFKKDGEQTADFINCVSFGKSAEFVEKYCHKGTKLIVEGRIQTGSYEKDGQRVYTTDIVVESQEFAESKSSASQNTQPTTNASASADDSFMNIPDDVDDGGLPFN